MIYIDIDKIIRVNTFGGKIRTGEINSRGEAVYHFPHNYNDTLFNIYKLEFLVSEEYNYLKTVSKRDNVSYRIFLEGAHLCPCIRPPTLRYCVDQIETGLAELCMTIQNRRKTQRLVCECSFCTNERCKEEHLEGIIISFLSFA